MKPIYKICRNLTLAAVVVFAVGTLAVPQANANPKPAISDAFNSRIIDDFVFTNKNTMSAAAIQAFLQARVPVCKPIGGPSDATNPEGRPDLRMPCLKDYVDPASGKSGAQMIYDIAQSRGINPQAILVMLDKENSMVSDSWPYVSQYNAAMGYGCPDGGSCAVEYYGLANQLNRGVTLMRAGLDRSCGNTTSYPGWSTTFPTELKRGNTTNGSGGAYRVDSTNTYIGTCATGSLYNYTPHRVDSAWIQRVFRPGVAATYYYGNYNFVTIFQRWFGSTWADPHHAGYGGQTNPPALVTGQAGATSISFVNTGGSTWTKGSFRLGTSRPLNRGSSFAGGVGWDGLGRIDMVQDSVAPGGTATFNFNMTANAGIAPGTYNEYFQPLIEGVAWLEDWGVYVPVMVAVAQHSATQLDRALPDMLDGNRQGVGTIRYRNTGTSTWTRDGFRLGTCAPNDHISELYTAGNWVSTNRIGMQEASVAPGGIATFRFIATAPGTGAGRFAESFCPVLEGLQWFPEGVTSFTVETGGTFASQYVGQSPTAQILPGETATQYVELRNTGTATWYNDGPHAVKLGTDSPKDRPAPSQGNDWLGATRIKMDQPAVAPGAVGRFTFQVKGPAAGLYREYLQGVTEGRTWFGNSNYIYYELNTVPRSSSAYAGQSPVSAAQVGVPQTVWVEYKNTGNVTWRKDGATPVRLGTARLRDRASSFATASNWLSAARIQMDQLTVAPGQIARFTFVATPSVAGNYIEYFQPVIEGVRWLEDYGMYFPFSVQ